jgi:glycosyltransferase involved in cell wall biosynthesis
VEAVASTIKGEAASRTARVLLVAPPARGGLARHVISLLSGLDRDGYKVGVACEPGGVISQAARERNLPFFEIPILARGGPSQAALAAIRIARAVNNLRAQIVHTHSFSAGLVGALAMPLASGGRLVATLHTYPPDAEGMHTRRRRDRWALVLLCRSASRLITVSDALRRDLLALRPDVAAKTVTIHNGIDTRAAPAPEAAEIRRSLEMPEPAPLVGMVARLAPQKGITDFIHAARAVLRELPSARFVLAGDGPLRKEAESLIRELRLEGRLRALGKVDSPRGLIAALDVLVVASTSEGSSIAAMEAMAAGKPVVATAVGGVPELVIDGETGVLVEPRRPEKLASAILSLLRRPERAQELGERGRRRAAAHFDVRHMLAGIEEVYADLLREEIDAGGAQ